MIRAVVFFSFLCAAQISAQEAAPPEALKYHELLRKRPQAGTLFDRFYDAWLGSGTAETLEAFLKAKAAAPEASTADQQVLALLYTRRGNDAGALAALDAALKLAPQNAEAWYEKARVQGRMLDFDGALKSLAAAAAAQPADRLRIEIARQQGRMLLRLGRTPEALQAWQSLAQQHPDDLDLVEEIVELMAEEGLYADASSQAKSLVEKTRDASQKLARQLRLGDLLLRSEKRDEALGVLEAALAQSGQDSWVEADVLSRIDQVYRREDDIEALKVRLQALFTAHPSRAAVAVHLARVLASLGSKEEAAKIFTTVLARNPGRRDLQEAYITLLEDMERISEAVVQAQVVVTQNPDDKESLIHLATLQQRDGKTDAAQATLDIFLKKSAVNGATPDHDQLRVARLLESWELKDAARKAYENLREAHPESISAREELAHYLHRSGDDEAALPIWQDLAKTGGVEDMLRIGQALIAHGKAREAQDILAGRQADFATQPRYLALLAQCALTNKDNENAVKWSRARLALTTDAAALQEAVRQAHIAVREAKVEAATIADLEQAGAAITLPNRCLLSEMLEEAGRSEAAEAALKAADAIPEQQLMLGSQLVRLLEIRQEWSKAADAVAALLQLPGGMTSDRTRQLVSLRRRGLETDKALAAIPDWKKLSPGAVQPWLEEAGLLMEQAKESAALDVLRAAARKFADDREVKSQLASFLAQAGKADEAAQVYMQLYEQTEDVVARMRVLAPLAQMSQLQGTLPKLVEDFQQRQRQNRASAQPWLALAEIHRATNKDEERRRCLYEASRLRPKDLQLLTEISRCEEENGLEAEALRTLQAAAQLDKTNATRQKIARLMIATGDEDAGYRLMFEIAGGSSGDARTLEQMADSLCEQGEWERAIKLLEPVLPLHPADYRLHYLHAVALEESDHRPAAVNAFMHLLEMHEELPAVLAAAAARSATAQPASYSGEIRDLPAGAAEWMQLPRVAHQAYEYRQKQMRGGYAKVGSGTLYLGSGFNPSAATSLPAGWLQQPANVTNLSAFALYHLVEIGQGLGAEEKKALIAGLDAAGLRDSALLLEVPVYQGQMGIPLDLLEQHPQHAALHALWLINQSMITPDTLPVLQRCMDMFKTRHPLLAFQVGMHALVLDEKEALALVGDALQVAENIRADDPHALSMLLSGLTRSGSLQRSEPLPETVMTRLVSLGRQWLKAPGRVLRPNQVDYTGLQFIQAVSTLKRWDDLAGVLEEDNARILKLPSTPQPAAMMFYSGGYGGYSQVQPQPLQPAWSGLDVSAHHAAVIASLQNASGAYAAMYQSGIETGVVPDEPEIRAGLLRTAARLTVPGLKTVMNLRLHDMAAVNTAVETLLKSPGLGVDHWLFAAWLAQSQGSWEKTISFLHEASRLKAAPAQRRGIDSAILYAVTRIPGEKTPEVRSAVQACITRMLVGSMQVQERQILAGIATQAGLAEQAAELQKAIGTSRVPVSAAASPYSRNVASQRGSNAAATIPRLLSTGRQDAAFAELKRQMKLLAAEWLGQNWSGAMNNAHNLRQTLESKQINMRFFEQLEASAGPGWHQQLELGAFFELMDQDDRARACLQRVVKDNPRSWVAHLRLAVLLASQDQSSALSHLMAIPDTEIRQFIQRLTYEAGRSHMESSSFEQRLALIRLLSVWIERHFNPKVRMDPMLAQLLMNLPQQVQQGEWNDPLRFPALYDLMNSFGEITPAGKKAQAQLRAAHDELCKAMIHVPVLAEGGFAPLAGLVEKNREPLEALEPLAREALERQAWSRRSMPALGYWYGRSQRRFAGGNQIALPHPEDVLLRALAQKGQMDRLETDLLPLIQNAQGAASVKQTRAYASLFTCTEKDFPQAAKEWMRSQAPYPDSSSGQEITRIWAQRKIGAPIHDFFMDRLRNPQLGVNTNELAGYVQILSENGHQDEAVAFARQLRDLWLGRDVEKRRQVLAGHFKEMTGGRRSFGWMGMSQQGPRPEMYVSFHSELLNQRCFVAIELAEEDHLLDEPLVFQQLSLANDAFVKGSSEKFLASLDALKLLAPAPSCRFWFSQSDRAHTHLGRVLDRLGSSNAKEERERLIKLINARKPQTFGADLFVSFLEEDYQKRAVVLPQFLKRRAGELSQLSAPAKRELTAFLRQHVRGYPGILDAETARLIAPLQAAENSQSEETADRILAASTVEGAGVEEYHFPRQVTKIIAELARTDREKAVRLLEHSIKLMKGTQQYLQSLRQPGSGNAVAEMIKAMGRAPQLMNEVVALAEKEHLPESWLREFGYAMEQDNALADKDHVLALFTSTPFVAEAGAFRSFAIPEGSLLSHLTSSLGSGSHKAARDALQADLKARQPQTFGVRLSLALISGAGAQRDAFIKESSADFASLNPREAVGLLQTFAYRESKFRHPEQLPADLQAALEPLLKACAASDEELRRALLASTTPMAYNDIEGLAALLRRIAQRDRAPAVELFDKVTLLVLAGHRGQNYGGSGAGLLGYWLREAAGIPQIFSHAMKAAEAQGILGERDWMQGVGSEITEDSQLQNAGTVRMFIDGSAMMADIKDFRSYVMEKDADGSILGRIARYVRSRKEVQAEISTHLTQLKPATFGSELLLAMIQDQPQPALVGFVKKHTAEISSMPAEQSDGLTMALEPALTPLSIYARGVPALETMLKTQAQKARDAADTLLAFKNVDSLHRNGNSDEQFARSLALIAQHEPARAREVFAHLLKLYDSYPDTSSSGNPAYTYPARFLSALYIDPGLWPLRSREATARKLSSDRDWRAGPSCDSCFNGHETDAVFIIDACTRAGWFADAAAFDPLPGCGGMTHESLLSAFLDSLWKSKKREPIRAILRKHIDAQTKPAFGMAFIRAMVDENSPAGMKAFADAHAAEFAQVPRPALFALYDIAASRSGVLADPSMLPAPVREALKPIHAERIKQEESFRDQVLQSRPFSSFKLSENGFVTEWRKALAERLRASDWDGAAALFNKGMQIMEEQQLEKGWGSGGSNNGWTLRSGLLEDFCQSSLTGNVVGFALKLFYEDESTRLQHSGWHTKYGWGRWMEMRWTTFGGRADPGAAADALIKELTPLVPAERTALLALGFHNFLTRLWKSDASAVVAWAEQQRASGARQALLRELATAGRLYLEADPSGMPPDATCAIGSTPVLDLLWKHYRKAMTDEKLPPRVRVALGHHLCATYPLAVPPEIVLAAARVTARENEVVHAVHGYNVAHIGRRFALLPVNAEWHEIAQNFWDGWVRRMSFQQQPANRGQFYGVYNEPLFAMLQIAARAKKDAWIDRLLNEDAPSLKSMRTTIAVLALAGAEARAAELLKKHAAEMTDWNSAIYRWEPSMQPHIATLAKACDDPGLALFGEVILAEAQDWKPALVNAFKSPTTFEQRIAALAPRIASTSFSSEALRVQVASIVANYAPVAARDHLKDLLSAAAQKQPVVELADMQRNGARMHASYVHGLVIASRAAAGDDGAARRAFDDLAELKSDANSHLIASARNDLASALNDAVTEFWKNGQAREIKLWQPLFEHLLQQRGPADDHSGYAASLLMALLAAAPDDTSSAYNQQLSQEKKTVFVKALSRKNTVISATAALAGREGSPARLPAVRRAQFVINLLNNPFIGRIGQPFQLMIREHRILTPQEATAHASAIALASPREGRTALELADYAVEAGKPDLAFSLLTKAVTDAAGASSTTFNILVRRLCLEIRQHKKQEAAETLQQVLKHDLAAGRKMELASLQKLAAAMK
ncbi:hypothetical protein [Prosthecobacter sp.]|uniref:hypothetical protein n=1 Tax=Prosthecobacter sp. TaxID=1965333 RepID=UPI0037834D5F